LLALALAAAGCGRTTPLGAGGDSGATAWDTNPPIPDGLILPDNLPPPLPDQGVPPPPPDQGPPVHDLIPPIPDAWIQHDLPVPPTDGPKPPPDLPGPTPDVWPWPPDTQPPLPDMPIPPDQGVCTPSCSQLCSVVISCGHYTGTYSKCVTECLSWTATQTQCLTKLVCAGISSCVPYGSCMIKPPQPDLVNKSFTASVSKSTVTYKVTTCNTGKGAAGAFAVDLFYDQKAAPKAGQTGNQSKQHTSLAVGACVSDTFTRTNTPNGTYASYVLADSGGAVSESSETNNAAGPVSVTVKVGPPPVKAPDLVVKKLTASTYTILGNTVVRYIATVCNSGTKDAAASRVDVYYNRKTAPTAGTKGNNSTSVPALKVGACTNRNIMRTSVGKGTYTSWAYADTANTIKESDENNNSYGPVTISTSGTKTGDLTIKSFTYQAYAYNTVLYRIYVCNVGTGATASTSVGLYMNLKSAPTSSTKPTASSSVGLLQPGQCSTRYITRVNTSTGTYSSWAFVDPNNYITETSETNNIKGPLKVSVGGTANKPDLYFKSFSAKMNGTKLDYKYQVCNQGKSAATPFRVDLYYNLSSAPKAKQSGGQASIVPVLNAGSCRTITRSRNNPPTGTSNAYVYADSWQWVSESKENNNVSGPVTTTLSTQGCTQICMFATYCGLFTWTQWMQCNNWCKGLDATKKKCVQTARQKQSCSDMKKCSLPKPPPPPPSPISCYQVCNYLVNTCKYLPSNQLITCTALCMQRSSSQVNCARKAVQAKQCIQTAMCLFQ